MDTFLYVLGLFGLALVIFCFGPILTIWSVNMLFNLTIPLNGYTWFATFWLHGIISGSTSKALAKMNTKTD